MTVSTCQCSRVVQVVFATLHWQCALRGGGRAHRDCAVLRTHPPLALAAAYVVPDDKIIPEVAITLGNIVAVGGFGAVHEASYQGVPCVLKVRAVRVRSTPFVSILVRYRNVYP